MKVTECNDVEKTLSSLGIAVRTSENEWREMGDVLNEVGMQWENYDDLTKNAIVTALAGVRQAENLRAAFNNYNKVLEYNESAYNAAGSAAQKYEVYLDSIEAKTNTMISTFQQIAYQPGFEALYKQTLDVATGFGQMLNAIAETPSVLAPVGGAIGTLFLGKLIPATKSGVNNLVAYGDALSQIGNVIQGGYFTGKNLFEVSKTSDDLIGMLNGLKDIEKQKDILSKGGFSAEFLDDALNSTKLQSEDLRQAIVDQSNATKQLDKAQGATAVTTGKLNKSMKALGATFMRSPILQVVAGMVALYGIIWAVDKLTVTTEENREALAGMNEELSDLESELSSTERQLEEIQERMALLKESGPLNLTDQTELSNLERQNALLQNTLELQKQNHAVTSTLTADMAEKALMDQTVSVDNKNQDNTGFMDGFATGFGTTKTNRIAEIDILVRDYLDTVDKAEQAIIDGDRELAQTLTDESNTLNKEITDKYLTIFEDLNSLYLGDTSQQMMADNIQRQLQNSLAKMGIDVQITPTFSFTQLTNEDIDNALKQYKGMEIKVPIKLDVFKDTQYIPIEEIGADIKSLNEKLTNSEISIEDYSNNIQSYLNSIDFSKIYEDGTEAGESLQALFGAFAQNIQGIYNYSIDSYNAGDMTGVDLFNNMYKDTGNIIDASSIVKYDKPEYEREVSTWETTYDAQLGWTRKYIEVETEASKATRETNEVIEAQTDEVKDAQAEMAKYAGWIDAVAKNQAYLNENLNNAGEMNFSQDDVGTVDYEKATNDVAKFFAETKEADKAVLELLDEKDIKLFDKMGNELDNVESLADESLYDVADNTNVIMDAVAETVGEKMQRVATAVEGLFTSLSDLIKHFSVTLTITPSTSSVMDWITKGGEITISGGSKSGSISNMLSGIKNDSLLKMVGNSLKDVTDEIFGVEKVGHFSAGAGGSPLSGIDTNPGGLDVSSTDEEDSGSDDILDEYDNAIKALEHMLKISENIQKNFEIGSIAWNDELEKQIGYYEQIKTLSHEQAEYLRSLPDGAEKYATEIAELQSAWMDANEEIRQVKITQIEDASDYRKGIVEYQRGLSETRKNSAEEGDSDWLDEIKEQINYNKQLQDIEESRADRYRDMENPALYINEIIESTEEWIDLQEQNLELIEEIKDAYEGIPDIIEDMITREKIEPLEKQKEILEGIKDLNTTIVDLEKDKAEAIMGGDDNLANQFQSQIDYIKQQKAELDLITDADEKRNKLKEIQLEMQRMTVDQLKAELALIQGQRTQRVYHEDKGWVWESDKQAEFDKQQEINDAEADAQIAEVDFEIDQWEDYIDALKDIPETYQEVQRELTLDTMLGVGEREALLNREISAIENYRDKMISAYEDVQQAQNSLLDVQDTATKDSSSIYGSSGNSASVDSSMTKGWATVPGVGKVQVDFKDGKTQTYGLPAGTIIHTDGGDYEITGGIGGDYTSTKVGGSSSSSSSSSSSGKATSTGSKPTKPATASSSSSSSSASKDVWRHDGIESGLLGDVPIDPQKEIFVRALKGEGVLTQEQMNNGAKAMRDLMLPSMMNSMSSVSNTHSNQNDNSVNIANMSVTANDANDFINQMRNLVAVTGRQ